MAPVDRRRGAAAARATEHRISSHLLALAIGGLVAACAPASEQATSTFDTTTSLVVDATPDTTSTTVAAASWIVTPVSEDPVALADWNPPLAFDRAGLPVIAYPSGPVGGELGVTVIRCSDPSCVERSASVFDAEAFDLDLAIGPDNLPLVVHQDFERISVTKCEDPGCNAEVTSVLAIDSSWAHVAIGTADPRGPTVTYQSVSDLHPRVMRCDDGACQEDIVEMLIEGLGGSGEVINNFDYDLPPGGLPVLLAAYGNHELWYGACRDDACAEIDAVVLDDGKLDDDTAALALAPDGLPLIAYYGNGELKVIKCRRLACSERSTHAIGPALVDFKATVAPSIAFGNSGLPLIAYWSGLREVTLAGCADDACSQSTLLAFGEAGSHTLGFPPDGLPILLYHDSGVLQLAKCQDLACLSQPPEWS